MNIQEYVKAIDEQWQTGNATEHSYRPALQQLLSEMLPQHTVTNEPSRRDCGAPDYIISQKKGAKQPVFFIEAKDLFDGDLDGMRQHKEQFNRYKSSLDYIVFTDYLDFHVYEHGEWVKNIRIGEQQGNHIRMIKGVEDDFTALIAHLADSKPTPITSPSRLAKQMAAKARLLANVVSQAFENAQDASTDCYHENTQLEGQLEAFRSILIHELEPTDFADIYAQTVAYGMFAARLHDETPEDFSRQEAAELIPKTNPFLRQIFQQIAGYDLDDRIAWIVDDLAQTFLVTDVEKVMKTYSGNSLHSDPMIHFYEDFLSEYNPKLRKSKGVWYTPLPVVQFIVRAVDEILQRDFHLPMGLADYSKVEHEVVNDQWNGKKQADKTIKRMDHRVQILDPATGTGTFLAEVVSQIYAKFTSMQGMWQGYVEEHLLPRLHGFEILMASYAVAHLKLDMQLRNMGYDSSTAKNQRLRIYLTNSLEECHPDTGTLWAHWLSAEANQANYIKRDCPVMVMVGNPPYNNSSTNNNPWILNKIKDYKEGLNEKKLNLDDDYVKFIRLAQDYIERNGQGIVGFITNNNYIDAVTFREMRHKLLLTYDDIYVVNLHGSVKKKETAPDGSKDENVFDIQQGTAIIIMVKNPNSTGSSALGKVHYYELYGRRESKYNWLNTNSLGSVKWSDITATEPYYFFVPRDTDKESDYKKGISITKLFSNYNSGIQTKRDSLNIHFTLEESHAVAKDFKQLSVEVISKKYNVEDSRDWQIRFAKNDLLSNPILAHLMLYRPFDTRFVNYTGSIKGIMGYPRFKTLSHLLKDNYCLITCRQQSTFDFQHVFITDLISDLNSVSLQSKEQSYVFPLYLYTADTDGTDKKIPNLNKDEWAKFDKAVGRATTPEELLHYIYAVLHSPAYRERYKEFLKIDFPRIPLPESEAEFVRLGELGHQLIDLHLMRNADRWKLQTEFSVSGDCKVDNLAVERNKDDGYSINVYINDTQFFAGVPTAAWNAYIGGYQPAQKWLKDRKGRNLSFEDIMHYLRIIYALAETQRIMSLI